MKGDFNQECNITSCQKPNSATWYNHSTRKYYCPSCAIRLNSDNFNKRDAERLFGHELCTEGLYNTDLKVQKYIRLLTYEEACKVVEFVNMQDKEDYANITVGGVSVFLKQSNISILKNYLENIGSRFELGDLHPSRVEQEIVKALKEQGKI